MSAKQTKKQPRPGRPATGVTKTKPSISIDKKLLRIAQKQAAADDVSFSAWVEDALRSKMERGAA